MVHVKCELFSRKVVVELVDAIDHPEGFLFRFGKIPLCGRPLSTRVIYGSIPIGHHMLHECAPNRFVQRVHEAVEWPCLVWRLDDRCLRKHDI